MNGDVSDQGVLSFLTTHVHKSKDHHVLSPGTSALGWWAAGGSGHTDCHWHVPRCPSGRGGHSTRQVGCYGIIMQRFNDTATNNSATPASSWLSLWNLLFFPSFVPSDLILRKLVAFVNFVLVYCIPACTEVALSLQLSSQEDTFPNNS